MKHPTPLRTHLLDSHFWRDIALLSGLFVVAHYLPFLKIVPLVACLELLSFFSFHLFAKRHSMKLQGFLGGFISSTAVFLRVLNDPKLASLPTRELMATVMLALMAMLVECLFILYFLNGNLPAIIYLPFVLQLVFFMAALVLLEWQRKNSSKAQAMIELELDIDEPIVWKNVAILSIFIIAMVSTMHFMGDRFGFSREISTLLISLFEAHAILAATLSEWAINPEHTNLLHMIFLILLGNTLSKSYILSRARNIEHKAIFITVLFANYLFSLLITTIIIHFN